MFLLSVTIITSAKIDCEDIKVFWTISRNKHSISISNVFQGLIFSSVLRILKLTRARNWPKSIRCLGNVPSLSFQCFEVSENQRIFLNMLHKKIILWFWRSESKQSKNIIRKSFFTNSFIQPLTLVPHFMQLPWGKRL